MLTRVLRLGALAVACTLPAALAAQTSPSTETPETPAPCEDLLDDALGEILDLIDGITGDIAALTGDGGQVMVSSRVVMLGPDGQWTEIDTGSPDGVQIDLELPDLGGWVWNGTDLGALPDFEAILDDFDFTALESAITGLIDGLPPFDPTALFDGSCFDFDFEAFDFDELCAGGAASGVVVLGPDGSAIDGTGDLSGLPGFDEEGLLDAIEDLVSGLGDCADGIGGVTSGVHVSSRAFTLGPDGQLVEVDPDTDLQGLIDSILDELEVVLPGGDDEE